MLHLRAPLKMDGALTLEMWLPHPRLKTELANSKLLLHRFLSPLVLPVWRVGRHPLFRLPRGHPLQQAMEPAVGILGVKEHRGMERRPGWTMALPLLDLTVEEGGGPWDKGGSGLAV